MKMLEIFYIMIISFIMTGLYVMSVGPGSNWVVFTLFLVLMVPSYFMYHGVQIRGPELR